MPINLLNNVDAAIRAGDTERAIKELNALSRKTLPDAIRLDYARMCRRVGLPLLSVRTLNPIVRPTGRIKTRPATDAEKAEYAVCLNYIGAVTEAKAILDSVDQKAVPEALLFEAFVLFSEWRYGESISYLEEYIKVPTLTDYQRLVGQANLASALIFVRDDSRATKMIEALIQAGSSTQNKLLHTYALELYAGLCIYQREASKALYYLDEATKLYDGKDSVEGLLIRKWRAIATILFKNSPQSQNALDKVKSDAIKMKNWETVRECDFFKAICFKDTEILYRVYFGTPFAEYRKRLLNEFEMPVALPKYYDYTLHSSGPKAVLDLATGKIEGRRTALKPGQNLHRLLLVFASDFYKPLRLATIHAELFPGEFFNPVSSPTRVHQVVKRLRQWLSTHRVPVIINEDNSSYSISSEKHFTLRVPQENISKEIKSVTYLRLCGVLPDGLFSSEEASKKLGLSIRATRDLLKKAREEGILQLVPKGRNLFYVLKRDNKSSVFKEIKEAA